MCFPKVATTTERLAVFTDVFPSIENRDYMIQLQMLRSTAIFALIISPFSALKGCKIDTVTPDVGQLGHRVILASQAALNHHFSMALPKIFRCFGNSLFRLREMFIAGCAFISDTFALARFGYLRLCFIGMGPVPKRIIGAGLMDGEALSGAASRVGLFNINPSSVKDFTAYGACKLSTVTALSPFRSDINLPAFVRACYRSSVFIAVQLGLCARKLFSALLASKKYIRRFNSSFTHAVMSPLKNGVNSGNNSYIRQDSCIVNIKESILSRARKEIFGKVQRLWDEAKSLFDMPVISRTSSPAERRDIVCATR